MSHQLKKKFKATCPPDATFSSLRYVEEITEVIGMRRGVLEPVEKMIDRGVMVTVFAHGGMGYASTADLSESGIRQAFAKAMDWAIRSKGKMVFDPSTLEMPHSKGTYASGVHRKWTDVGFGEKLDLLKHIDGHLPIDQRIIDWSASLMSVRTESLYLTNEGGEVHQSWEMLAPDMMAVAHHDGQTQKRSFGSRGISQQTGWEVFDRIDYKDAAPRVASEAIQLLEAPDCPTGNMDLILMPDQMMLQIHESIGHPLELDRILGDERNYAGTSFVTQDMFGTYQYGSELLNVTFDPAIPEEFASYAFDDNGTPAEKTFLIRNGVLEKPLGAAISQHRANMEGVANSRACSWNRPPMDRMANLNLEPGNQSLDELVSSVERGVLMHTNTSWSIDDSRNKFQFGCELGEIIENGERKGIVKNPNYRGISATFWRSLKGVGNRDTFEVLGTPYCGKGEPNQVIRVGHASPACLFGNIDVFGGA
jgi:predicted Zn-dependent protease